MKISTKKLFLKQYINNKLIRYDVIIRCITVEHFIKHRKMHYLYELDCIERTKFVLNNPESEVTINEGINRFKNTILNFEKVKIFDKKNPMLLYKNYIVKDGIHRLAICISLKIPYIYYNFNENNNTHNFPDLNYYQEHFTEKELNMLIEKEKELLNEK